MHVASTSETIYDAFNHRTLAGLAGARMLSLGTCPCELPAIKFAGLGASAGSSLLSAGISAGGSPRLDAFVALCAVAAGFWLYRKMAKGFGEIWA